VALIRQAARPTRLIQTHSDTQEARRLQAHISGSSGAGRPPAVAGYELSEGLRTEGARRSTEAVSRAVAPGRE
jgi:hypothetical protein